MKTNEVPEKIYMTPSFWEPENVSIAHFSKNPKDFHHSIEYTRTDAIIEKVYNWLKNYAFVDDNLNVNLPILLHDFLKDSRIF